MMEALQMLKYSFRKGLPLDFTAGTDRDVEIADLESFMSDAVVPPVEVDAYLAWIRVPS